MTATKKRPHDARASEPSLGERFNNAIENEPPTGEQEREVYWNETLFMAMAELRSELTSENERVRAKAAHKIIDLERTKMRHGKRLGQPRMSRDREGASDAPRMSRDREGASDAPRMSRDREGASDAPLPCGRGSEGQNDDGLKPELQRNQKQVVERLKAELDRVAELKARAERDAETEAFGFWASRVRAVVDDLAKKFSFGWGAMSVGESEGIVRKYMEMNSVSAATEIDGRDLLLVVMNMVADEKERREKSVVS